MNGLATDSLAPAAVVLGEWSLVPEATMVRFRVRDKLVTTVQGTFPVLYGSVSIGDGEASDVCVELDAAGVDIGNARRDRDLRAARFLDVLEHPTIVVTAEAAGAEPGGWRLAAGVAARGRAARRPSTSSRSPRRAPRPGPASRDACDRAALGIRVPTFIVGRYVDLDVTAVCVRGPRMQSGGC